SQPEVITHTTHTLTHTLTHALTHTHTHSPHTHSPHTHSHTHTHTHPPTLPPTRAHTHSHTHSHTHTHTAKVAQRSADGACLTGSCETVMPSYSVGRPTLPTPHLGTANLISQEHPPTPPAYSVLPSSNRVCSAFCSQTGRA